MKNIGSAKLEVVNMKHELGEMGESIEDDKKMLAELKKSCSKKALGMVGSHLGVGRITNSTPLWSPLYGICTHPQKPVLSIKAPTASNSQSAMKPSSCTNPQYPSTLNHNNPP